MMYNLHLKDEVLVVAVSAADIHNRYFSVPQVSRHFLLQKRDVHNRFWWIDEQVDKLNCNLLLFTEYPFEHQISSRPQ